MLPKSRKKQPPPGERHPSALTPLAMQAALQLYMPPEDDSREALQPGIQAALTNIQRRASRSDILNMGSKL